MKDFLNNLIGNISSNFVWAALVVLAGFASSLFKKLKLARTKTIWKPFFKDKTLKTRVVLTTKPSESKKPSGTMKVSLTEVAAFSEIRKALLVFDVDPELIQDPNIKQTQLSDGHLVLVGGPGSNNISKVILEGIKNKFTKIPFAYDDAQEGFLFRGQILKSVYNQVPELVEDYGMVIKVRGLFQQSNQYTMFAFGLRGWGTLGAIRAITVDKDVLKDIETSVGMADFALLLKFKFHNQELIGTEILCPFIIAG